MSVPDWWAAALLVAAAWRTFQLLSADDILSTPRGWVEDRLSEKWRDFLSCPYCFGFWVALGWWAAWQIWAHGTLVVAGALLLSTGVIALAKVLSFDE